MKHSKIVLGTICAILVITANLQAQTWKPCPHKSAWSQHAKNGIRDLERVRWHERSIGDIEIFPGPGLQVDRPVTFLGIGKKQARIEALDEQEGPLKVGCGGLLWPSGVTMIGEPNDPDIERCETKEWIAFRLTWATGRQGYAPSGIAILAWNKASQKWCAWGSECDAIELVSQNQSKVTFKASGAVGTNDGYQRWSEVVHLIAHPDTIAFMPAHPKLAPINP